MQREGCEFRGDRDGALGAGRDSAIRRVHSLYGNDAREELLDCIADVLSGPVIDGSGGPGNAVTRGRPNPKKRLTARETKAPPIDEIRHRRTYDLNKELADYLRCGMTIKIGCQTAGITSDSLVGDGQKRPR